MDDPHHGPSYAHVDGLGHLRQEVLLDLKAPFPDAPASIHQESQVHLTVCRTRRELEQMFKLSSIFSKFEALKFHEIHLFLKLTPGKQQYNSQNPTFTPIFHSSHNFYSCSALDWLGSVITHEIITVEV